MIDVFWLTSCCSCNDFPKFKKKLGPSFDSFFCSVFGFAWCLRKDYFYAGDVLMFELIFPLYQKCFGLLSRESSHLRAHHFGKEQDITSDSNVIGLRCVFFVSNCFEILSEPLSIHLLPLRRRFCEVVRDLFNPFPIPTILSHRSLVFSTFVVAALERTMLPIVWFICSAWSIFFAWFMFILTQILLVCGTRSIVFFTVAALQPSVDPKP